MKAPTIVFNETDHKHRLDALELELGADWERKYRPGSSGCHELLDRTMLAAEFVERHVHDHPACSLNPEWFALAEEAVTVLQRLYQQVGEAHMDAEES